MAVEAVDEVGNPTILATFAVIAAILPMAFVGGPDGPVHAPDSGRRLGGHALLALHRLHRLALGRHRLLRAPAGGDGGHDEGAEDWTTRLYRRLMTPLLTNGRRRGLFLGVVGLLLLLASCSLVYFKLVRVKMLPFDNKSELQVIVDMPEGTTLEETARVTPRARRWPWRTDPRGDRSPDLRRHGGALQLQRADPPLLPVRQGPNVADIQVNLPAQGERERPEPRHRRRVCGRSCSAIAGRHGARIKVAEVPPGPPVLQTLVAEVYGDDRAAQLDAARRIQRIFERTPGVVDVDWYVEDPQPGYRFVVDKEKAALLGISTDQMVETLRIAVTGASPGLAHLPAEKEDVPIFLRLPRDQRSGVDALAGLRLKGGNGALVPLVELARVEATTELPLVYRKNLKRVVYVTGDVAGEEESPVYAILQMNRELDGIAPARRPRHAAGTRPASRSSPSTSP